MVIETNPYIRETSTGAKQSVMRACFFILTMISVWACQSKERADSFPHKEYKPAYKEPEKIVNEKPKVSSQEMQAFWNECVEPMKSLDKEKLKKCVNFPLGGDWGYIVGFEKDGKELSEDDFYNNLDSIFYPELMDSLRRKTIQDVEIYETEDRQTELLLSIGWEKWIDDFKAESATIYRFKKINSRWMLYAIQVAG